MVRRGFPWLALLVLTLCVWTRRAHADPRGAHTVPVAVLAFDSEDAEEQADAFTGAIRSRIRATPGWSLIETTQSLGMLTAAMKCGPRPPLECQQKIAEQIKAERYIWSFLSKSPTVGQVTAEVHLYQKGKPDTVVNETYADNLKDSNDDTLRKIAARVVERLGATAIGVVVVRSTVPTGEVIVDGEKHVPLDKGTARIEVGAGGHSVEVAPTNGAPSKRNVIAAAGQQTVMEFTPDGAAGSDDAASAKKTRKVIGGISMGAGAVLAGVAIYSLVHYLDLQSQGEGAAASVAKTDPPTPCKLQSVACARIDSDSKTASALALGLGGGAALAIGVGAYLFFSEPSPSSSATSKSAGATTSRKLRVLPTASVDTRGVLVVGSF